MPSTGWQATQVAPPLTGPRRHCRETIGASFETPPFEKESESILFLYSHRVAPTHWKNQGRLGGVTRYMMNNAPPAPADGALTFGMINSADIRRT
jgi:hypothetical protein